MSGQPRPGVDLLDVAANAEALAARLERIEASLSRIEEFCDLLREAAGPWLTGKNRAMLALLATRGGKR